MKFLETNPIVFLGIIWAGFIAINSSVLPLLPIDETRYMTVAWEMHVSNNWILPTLNFEAYSHKPPMLFWLINAVWSVTGLEIWGVRVMSGLIAFTSVPLLYLLAKNLFPNSKDIRNFSPVVLMASPVFFIYGTIIMFDFLQTIFVLIALIALVKAKNTGTFSWWIIYGVMLGLGILAKGPVMLVHVIFPALLAPIWSKQDTSRNWGAWYLKLLIAVFLGAAIALLWALPAAVQGGETFTNEIFWSQSSGRISQSFAHRKPFWFYIPILAVAFLPFILWPRLWGIAKAFKSVPLDSGIKFLLCWIVPTIFVFSLISGKQIHYIIPEISGIAILITVFVFAKNQDRKGWFIPFCGYFVLFLVFHLSPVIFGIAGFGDQTMIIDAVNARSNLLSTVFIGLFVFGTLLCLHYFKCPIQGQLVSFVLMAFLFISLFSLQMSRKGFEYYDLNPIADYVNENRDKDWAFVHKYQGEIGFLGQLEKPMMSLQKNEIEDWYVDHPDGMAVIRYNKAEELPHVKMLMTMPYRSKNIGIFVKK